MKTPKPMPRIRVAAIIVREDAILLARHKKDNRTYWVLPGGGVHYGETLEQALVREMNEEACLDIRVGDLVLVNDSIPPDEHRHIVNLHFIAEIVRGEITVSSGDKRLIDVRFMPVNRLSRLTLYPDIRKQLLQGITHGFAHVPQYLRNLWKDA
jgi:ADP-ribose pyrophosphatase YjhB (NUDIX family)